MESARKNTLESTDKKVRECRARWLENSAKRDRSERQEGFEALQRVIPIVFESAAQNILDFVKYDVTGNPKKEIKNVLYETVLGLLDKYVMMNGKLA